jgi:hypothetical protein
MGGCKTAIDSKAWLSWAGQFYLMSFGLAEVMTQESLAFRRRISGDRLRGRSLSHGTAESKSEGELPFWCNKSLTGRSILCIRVCSQYQAQWQVDFGNKKS